MSCAFRLDIGLTLTSFLTTPLMLVGGFYLNKGSVWRERDELKQVLREGAMGTEEANYHNEETADSYQYSYTLVSMPG